MADYSGAWGCSECKASGTGYSGNHAPWCSVTAKIAAAEQARRERDEAVAAEKRRAESVYAAMGNDRLADEYDLLTRARDRVADEMKELDVELDAVRRVIRDRGILSYVLDRRWDSSGTV